MPFMGQDWRAPGERWIKTHEGWEQMKLRPVQQCSCSDTCLLDKASPTLRYSPNELFQEEGLSCSPPMFSLFPTERVKRISNESESSDLLPILESEISTIYPETETETEDDETWQPHCFVKTGKSKEFVGCTSMSEAFHKLNIGREVTNGRRFHYICKIVQILVREKLQNLSGSARKILCSVVAAIVLHSSYSELRIARVLVGDFLTGLYEHHHCGSPQLLYYHQDAVSNLQELLSSKQPSTPADSGEDSVTFLDLPRECLRLILRRLPDHQGLLEAAKAHEALETLVETEQKLWRSLCDFHFTQTQVDTIRDKLERQRVKANQGESDNEEIKWRHMYFELKKFYGLREVYADMIHICCHCKALYWKGSGHPCLSSESPSVRVTPQQFVDMLMLL